MVKCTAPVKGHRGDRNGAMACPVHGSKKNTKAYLQSKIDLLAKHEKELRDQINQHYLERSLLEAEDLLVITPENMTSKDASEISNLAGNYLYKYSTSHRDSDYLPDNYDVLSDDERDIVDALYEEHLRISNFVRKNDNYELEDYGQHMPYAKHGENQLYLSNESDYENNGEELKKKTETFFNDCISTFNKYPSEDNPRRIRYLEPSLSSGGSSYHMIMHPDSNGEYSNDSTVSVVSNNRTLDTVPVSNIGDCLYNLHKNSFNNYDNDNYYDY